jgi:hypothetical protein
MTPTLPAERTSLSAIVNPNSAVDLAGVLYIRDFNASNIQAMNLSNYNIITFGGNPAFAFRNAGDACHGVNMDLVGGEPYVLFSSGHAFAASWTNSAVSRLSQNASAGRLFPVSQTRVGLNATSMLQVTYQPTGATSPKNSLLVSRAGAERRQGLADGANSVIAVVETGANFAFMGSGVEGVFAIRSLEPDLKSMSATPRNSGGDSLVFVAPSSYASNWDSEWGAFHSTVSAVIDAASDGLIMDLEDFTQFAGANLPSPGATDPGYFWVTDFSLSGGDNGTLVVGRGDPTDDRPRFYPVNSSGPGTAVVANSAPLYGVSGRALNSITLTQTASAMAPKVPRAFSPRASVASARVSLPEFLEKPRNNPENSKE